MRFEIRSPSSSADFAPFQPWNNLAPDTPSLGRAKRLVSASRRPSSLTTNAVPRQSRALDKHPRLFAQPAVMAQPQVDMVSEEAHLLEVDDHPDQPISHKGVRLNPSRWQVGTPGTVVLLVATAKFSVVASGMMILMPVYRLIEDALCHAYYEDNSPDIIDEMKCKVDDVQTRLSTIMGWLSLISNLMSTSAHSLNCSQHQLTAMS